MAARRHPIARGAGRAHLAGALAAVVLALAPGTAVAGKRAAIGYATRETGYIRAGRLDGVEVGDTLTVEVRQKAVGTCKVEAVADHYARCASRALPPRAVMTVPQPPPRSDTPPPHDVRTDVPVARVRRALSTTPFEAVEYHAPTSRGVLGSQGVLRASMSHDVWTTSGLGARNQQAERLEVSARGIPLAGRVDLAANLRLTALYWSERTPPPSAAASRTGSRFLSTRPAQVFVWEGDVVRRQSVGGVTFAVGRVVPYYLPGVAVLDGAQAGWRRADGDAEVGAYAGTVPSLATLDPSAARMTVGVYGMVQGHPSDRVVVQGTARAGFISLADHDNRYEVEALAQLSWGSRLQVAVSPRLGFDPMRQVTTLDALRASLTGNVSDKLAFYAATRLFTPGVDVIQGLVGPPPTRRTTIFSDAGATYHVTPWLSLGAMGARALDVASGIDHLSVGPEIGLPRLFGSLGGLTATYLFETSGFFGPGAILARSAFLASRLAPSPDFALGLTASYFEDTFQTDRLLREMSLGVQPQWRLGAFWVGGFARLRHGLRNPAYEAEPPYNLTGSVQVGGAF
jgi:hypothetical protein